MADDPFTRLEGLLSDLADRVGRYAEIWQAAAARNAANEYGADDLLADVQRAFELGLRDAAEIGASLIDAFGTVVPVPGPPAAQSADSTAPEATQ